METRFIKSLLKVVETGSFAGAARSENLTAAAVSQRIRTLEAELGEALFVRAGQCVVPTAACRSMLPRLREICDKVGEIVSDLHPDGMGGDLRIGAVSTTLSDLLPNVIAKFASKAPSITLHVTPGTSGELFRKLSDSEIDAAFMVRPLVPVPKQLLAVHIVSQPFVIIVQSNDLRTAQELITSERVLVYDTDSWGGSILQPWLNKHVAPEKIICELDALETIAAATAQGIGYAIVPDWQGLAKFDGIRKVALPYMQAKRDVVLLHRRLKPAPLKLLCGGSSA